jgi:hypothetical protein
MDDARFDALTRSLTRGTTRRGLGRLLGGLTLGGPLASLLTSPKTAAKQKKKKSCPPCKKKKDGKCKTNKPDGTLCENGGSCLRGSCQPAEAPPDPPPPAPPEGCPSGQKPCAGGCIASSQCCTNADCPVSGQVCNAGRQCACPAALPETCGGACLAPCESNALSEVRNPETCACCVRHNFLCVGGPGSCCSLNYYFSQQGCRCVGRAAGASCSFPGQCASNNCLCGAFGCACQ